MHALEACRDDFPFLTRTLRGKPIIYFDNAATTQLPQPVLDALADFHAYHNGNIHRGLHTLSHEASQMYQEARRKVARFINADEREIIFVRNATEGINLVCQALEGSGSILSPLGEHHSNLLPWRRRNDFEHVQLDRFGRVDRDDLRHKLRGDVRLVAVSHVSNVLGLIHPIESIIDDCKSHGALSLVDAAQSIPHLSIDVKSLDCDFLVFSGHKMLAPAGIGVLYVKEEHYDRLTPAFIGGGTVQDVHENGFSWSDPPACFEAGTPNIGGAIALGAAIDYLEQIGRDHIRRHCQHLTEVALGRLAELGNVAVYGEGADAERLSIITFNVEGLSCHTVAKVLNLKANTMIRSGYHCAQPLHEHLQIEPTARMSFYLYNTEQEIDDAVSALAGLAEHVY